MTKNTASTIIKTINSNKEQIKQFGVKKIGLFGSYSRNEHNHKSSDVDILVKFQSGKKTFDNYMGLKLFLETVFHIKVDLVTTEALKREIKPYIINDLKYATEL
jgi:hypothetical protein